MGASHVNVAFATLGTNTRFIVFFTAPRINMGNGRVRPTASRSPGAVVCGPAVSEPATETFTPPRPRRRPTAEFNSARPSSTLRPQHCFRRGRQRAAAVGVHGYGRVSGGGHAEPAADDLRHRQRGRQRGHVHRRVGLHGHRRRDGGDGPDGGGRFEQYRARAQRQCCRRRQRDGANRHRDPGAQHVRIDADRAHRERWRQDERDDISADGRLRQRCADDLTDRQSDGHGHRSNRSAGVHRQRHRDVARRPVGLGDLVEYSSCPTATFCSAAAAAAGR